ncbi:MAG: hypothetical protein U5K79_07080 [Cyclobacteriaceae bacterium]|nr:hypothetical protein [Cyclobacteriaceae bacterium]
MSLPNEIFFLKGFNKMLIGNFDLILTGSERLKRNITAMNNNLLVKVTGDSRIDQVLSRKVKNQRDHFSRNPYKNIVLGSLIPSDYSVVFGGIRKYWGMKNGVQMEQQLIVVPHEVFERDINELTDSLKEFGFSYSYYSQTKELGTSDTMIIDCVGILAEVYCYGFCAYVGAGFGAGVHSVIEPAVYTIPVAFGPNINLLDEAVELANLGAGIVVKSREDFASFLELAEKKSEIPIELTRKFIDGKNGASRRIVENILKSVEEGYFVGEFQLASTI